MAKNFKHLPQIEARIRAELENEFSDVDDADPAAQRIADGVPAEIDRLRRSYEMDRNPVDVWDAILQLHFEARIKRLPLVLPAWVLAYVVAAATGIMGTAVNRPEYPQVGSDAGKKVKKSRSPRPLTNPDGIVTRFSRWYGGAKSDERVKLAIEALGFAGGQGRKNALALAHGKRKKEELVRRAAALKRQGLTDEEAVKQINDPQLTRSGDPVRQLRRARNRG